MGMLYKNGSIVAEGNCSHGNDNGQYPASRSTWLVPMNGSSDYIEIYVLIVSGSGSPEIASDNGRGDGGYYGTRFGAYKIRE